MTKLTRASLLKHPFSDKRFYPYGFSRSGDFSINESNLLTQYGSLIAALIDGELLPECDAEKGYIDVALGRRAPNDAIERVWSKYQQRINRPHPGSIYGTKMSVNNDEIDETTSSNKDDITQLNIQPDTD